MRLLDLKGDYMTDNKALLLYASQAMEKAYAPYSNFKVGAALLTESGKIYTGCNIENLSYGATICAERVAIFKAISDGEKNFTKIAIVSSDETETFPCGICRQVMAEFMPQGEVVTSNGTKISVFEVSELLPMCFNNNF